MLGRRAAGRLLVALSLLALLGCPRKGPQSSGSGEAERPVVATLAHSFDEIDPALYDRVRASPPGTVPLAVLEAEHDVARYTATPTLWGTHRVIEFSATDRPHSSVPAVAGWILGPRTEAGDETVESVLLRGFEGAPRASSFEELLVGLQPTWSLPWHLCQPERSPVAAQGVVVIAVNQALGTKIGLVQVGADGDAGWQVDHVEFFSTRLNLDLWWVEKDYGQCVPVGTVTTRERFKASGARD